jgi:hypothetical protein
VGEQVRRLIVGRDEPEALVVAKPLDGSRRHFASSCASRAANAEITQNKATTASAAFCRTTAQPDWHSTLAATGVGDQRKPVCTRTRTWLAVILRVGDLSQSSGSSASLAGRLHPAAGWGPRFPNALTLIYAHAGKACGG